MRLPRGLTVKFSRMEKGKLYCKIRASKFYLFKVILKIARQNIRKPALALLIFLFAFYWLIKTGGGPRIIGGHDARDLP